MYIYILKNEGSFIMEQYMKKMKMLFYRQTGVSLLQEDEAIIVRINRSDIGEEAGSWLSATKKRVEKKIPELEQADYGCHEIVYVKFKEKKEVRKQSMKQYVQSIEDLFHNQPNVSIQERTNTISVFVDYEDVGEDAKYWMKDSIDLVVDNIPELEYDDHGCHELVYVKFKEKEEFRKKQIPYEVVRFTLEEIEKDSDLYFSRPLEELGLELYKKHYSEEERNTVSLLYNFWEVDNQPRLVVEGTWIKSTHENYYSFEKRIKQVVKSLKEKLHVTITNTPNWETLSDEDPIREKILDKYAIHKETYSEEIEKKLEKIQN